MYAFMNMNKSIYVCVYVILLVCVQMVVRLLVTSLMNIVTYLR